MSIDIGAGAVTAIVIVVYIVGYTLSDIFGKRDR